MDTAGLMSGVRDAQNALGRIDTAAEQTAKKTEDVGKTLQKALKGEVLVGAANRIGGALQGLGGDFKGLGEAVNGAGAILQGLFQGGVIGAGIAAAGVGVSALVKSWGEAEKAARDAEKAQQEAMQAHVEHMKSLTAGMDKATSDLAGALRALREGTSVDVAVRANKMDSLGKRESMLQGSIDRRRAALESAQSRLAGPEGAFYATSTPLKETIAVLQSNLADLERSIAKVSEEYSVVAADAVAAEKTAEANRKATRGVSEFAKALAQARGWLPDDLMTPGAKVRQAKDIDSFGVDGPGGSIRREAAERAERNAGYRANAAETVFGDGDQARMAARDEQARTSFARAADEITDTILKESFEFADAINNAFDASARVLAGIAPKTGQIIDSVMKGDFVGALTQALSHSKEGQALGKALDTGLVDIINAITELLRPAVPVLTMAIRGIAEGVKLVADVIAILFNAAGLDTVFAVLFETVKFFAAVLAAGAAATDFALKALQNGMRQGAINFLSMFGDAFKTQIDDLRSGIVQQGDFGASVAKAFDDVMSIGFNAEQAAIGMGDAADAANRVAQSFLNLPAGFKVAQAMFDATSASSAPFGGFMPPVTSPQLPAVAAGVAPTMGPTGGGDIFNFYGPIYVSGDEGFTNVVTVSARQNGMATSGTDSGGARTQRPTAYAPTPTPP